MGIGAAGLFAAASVVGAGSQDPLGFDSNKFVLRTVTVGDQTVSVRAYEGIVTVAKPLDPTFQRLNVYIPTAYFEGGTVHGYNAQTAPIFLPNQVGGYMPGRPGVPGPDRSGAPNAIAQALVRGYVVASPGARGWPLRDAQGRFIGKAPAAIVDLKAAVRWLRHNDALMPGNAERIISNGGSAGGALSALLGATGNNPDYEPYLKAIGATSGRDDVFAASCYCPITNLENADSAYEWQFRGIHEYRGRGFSGTLNARQIEISEQLRALFPAYVNRLQLKAPDGSPLTLDANGDGPFKDYVKSFLIASAQKALDGGKLLSEYKWITIEGGKVKDLDFAQYVRFIGRMKPAPAFDDLELMTPETALFGSETTPARHFTPFAKEHSSDKSIAEPSVIRMMNPMHYIGSPGTRTSLFWRIRHGAADSDTSFAIPVLLATRLRNAGAKVDFALPWAVGHARDYDLSELFAWIDEICR